MLLKLAFSDKPRFGNLLRSGGFQPYYEGEEEEGGGENKEWDGKFTEEQQKAIDGIIKKRFKKEREEKEKLIQQLNSLKESSSLTQKERDELQARIEEMENSLLTKEEQLAKQQAEAQKRHKKELEKVQSEAELWKTRYTDSTIERALTDAAVQADALNPAQLRMMFRGSTYLAEDKDEATGKPTGTFTPYLKFVGLNEDGEQTEFDLPVADAIKKIKEDGLNANLFKSKATGGTGQHTSGGRGKGSGDPSAMPVPENFSSREEYSKAYQQWRNEYNIDGTRRRKANAS